VLRFFIIFLSLLLPFAATGKILQDNFKVKSAYTDGKRIILKGQKDNRSFYCASSLEKIKQPTTNQKLNPFTSLLAINKEAWIKLREKMRPVSIYPYCVYRNFEETIVQAISQEKSGQGVLLPYYRTPLFIYKDSRGQFKRVLFHKKPRFVSIDSIVTLENMTELIFKSLDSVLPDKKGATKLLFNTGDFLYGNNCFLYVDLDKRIFAFFRQEFLLPPKNQQQKWILKKITKKLLDHQNNKAILSATIHIVENHTISLLNHPISSIFNLFFILKHTCTDFSNRTIKELLKHTYWQYKPIPPLNNGPGMDIKKWEQQLDKITATAPCLGKVSFLIGGREFFPRFIDLLINAKKSIKIRSYIFDNDDYAALITALLMERSKQGIEIKILIDGLGSKIAEGVHAETLPDPWRKSYVSFSKYLKLYSEIKVRNPPNIWMTSDHTKSIIIDNKTVFVGGMNIGREYRFEWHDIMMQIQGPVVDLIDTEFNKAWKRSGILGDLAYLIQPFSTKKTPNNRTNKEYYPIHLLYTKPNRSEIYIAQLKAIQNAKHHIYIENPYFSDDIIIYELCKARKRGVDVRLIITQDGNHTIMNKSNVISINTLLKQGVRVYIYPAMTHVKAAIYDGWACLGSANFDKLSLRVNNELNLGISEPKIVNTLKERLFEKDFKTAKELTEPLPENWIDYLYELLAEQL
jgi:cardiolipin synthase A/B